MGVRTFHFERSKDISGISGVGAVAFGAMFYDGQIALHWEGPHSSINIYKSLEDMLFIHSHNGSTIIIWDNEILNEEKLKID